MANFIILPTYNERENLPFLAEEIFHYLPNGRILVVDDGSPDGTGELADDLKRRNSGCFEVHHRKNKEGLGKAYLDGFAFVLKNGAEKIIQMDADRSHLVLAMRYHNNQRKKKVKGKD